MILFCNVSRCQCNPEVADHLYRKFTSYHSSRYLYNFLTGWVNRLVGWLNHLLYILRVLVCLIVPTSMFKDVRANYFCVSLLRTQIYSPSYMEHMLSNKMNNDRQMTIGIAFPGFNNLGRSLTPIFLFLIFWWIIFSTNFLRLAKNRRKSFDLKLDFLAKCTIEFRF